MENGNSRVLNPENKIVPFRDEKEEALQSMIHVDFHFPLTSTRPPLPNSQFKQVEQELYQMAEKTIQEFELNLRKQLIAEQQEQRKSLETRLFLREQSLNEKMKRIEWNRHVTETEFHRENETFRMETERQMGTLSHMNNLLVKQNGELESSLHRLQRQLEQNRQQIELQKRSIGLLQQHLSEEKRNRAKEKRGYVHELEKAKKTIEDLQIAGETKQHSPLNLNGSSSPTHLKPLVPSLCLPDFNGAVAPIHRKPKPPKPLRKKVT